jgi:hypothetical protein
MGFGACRSGGLAGFRAGAASRPASRFLAAFTSACADPITRRGLKVFFATDSVIGPTLGSPPGRILKLPVMLMRALHRQTAQEFATPAGPYGPDDWEQ